MGSHWVVLVLSALLAAAAGCSKGNESEPESVVPTPDFPAAGTDAEPGDPESEDEGDGATAKGGSSSNAAKAPASVDVKAIAPSELEQLVAQNKGKVVLFDFWATWCVPCVKQYPHTVALSKTHAKDLVVYAVSFDEPDDLAPVKKFLADHGVGNVHPLISSDGASEESYEGFDITGGALPHYKVFGRDGQLVATLGGDVDNPPDAEKVDAAVAKALGK
jgi:thiol-disulfide isomerase/thioredoxin